MAQCPYCGKKMRGKESLPFIPKRQMRIYEAVTKAGKEGVMPKDLLPIFYGDKEIPPGGAIVMRVQIHELNKALSAIGQRIQGRQGYRLVSIP